ncbi:MAG TPA: beta-ketoacyl synthase N-terminal-like domain-containing protein [Puia sp.]|nr:beta-ketoacyl synthase N-terminal-like domain-containing protein [Puia sp.]
MSNAEVFIASDNICSPLGSTTAENFSALAKGISGIRLHDDPVLSAQPFYAALFGKEALFMKAGTPGTNERISGVKGTIPRTYTKFEQLLIASISTALQDSGIGAGDKKTVLILSSTKGNISLLETAASDEQAHPGELQTTPAGSRPGVASEPVMQDRIALHTSASLIAEYFGFRNPPIVASNACISGIMAILTGFRLIRSGQYENAVIAGADVISNFVLSGFQSFQAISSRPCRPFDKSRDGITLGEGAATVVLSSNSKFAGGIKIMGGSTSNDANHLSAPSRTGEELSYSIKTALGQAGLSATDIDFISAHGTATLYNDEMEAKAITLANLQSVPVNSLKGYYGHTLGAAGLIESIIAAHSLKANRVLPTIGFEQLGVSQPLNICSTLLSTPLKNCLKTASGFGGCNAALVLSKP